MHIKCKSSDVRWCVWQQKQHEHHNHLHSLFKFNHVYHCVMWSFFCFVFLFSISFSIVQVNINSFIWWNIKLDNTWVVLLPYLVSNLELEAFFVSYITMVIWRRGVSVCLFNTRNSCCWKMSVNLECCVT